MSVFLGGSAYTMVRDIAEGYVIASELTFKKFQPGDFQTFGFELDKLLREIRGNVPPTGATSGRQRQWLALVSVCWSRRILRWRFCVASTSQKRHRKMQRLQQAL